MASERPNILLVMTDQQRGDCLGVEGHPVLQTPTLDGLAEVGVRFSHFYSACPTCIPARRSLLAGQNPATHGMVGYQDGVAWDAPVTLPQALKNAGYQTYLVGRSMHQHPPRRRFGFDEMEINDHNGVDDYGEWLRQNGPAGNGGWFGSGVMHNDWTVRPWPLEEHLHFTNWTVARAERFLARRDPSVPYFLVVSFIAPHPPLQPPDFYLQMYLHSGVPEPVVGDWAERPVPGRGSFFHDGHWISDHVSAERVELRGERLLYTRAAYFALITHVDAQIRRLLNPINGINRLGGRDTVVVFTSDHGEMLGDHYRWRKGLPYEPSARVPFLVSAPQRFGLTDGSVLDCPATHVDIMPTLLDMAGVETPSTVEGRSLLPVLTGQKKWVRDWVHIEHSPSFQCLTDGREKYVWLAADGTEQFFDLQTDPNELQNLAGRPAVQKRMAVWRDRLVKTLSGRPEGFVSEGRLVPGRPYPPVIQKSEDRHKAT